MSRPCKYDRLNITTSGVLFVVKWFSRLSLGPHLMLPPSSPTRIKYDRALIVIRLLCEGQLWSDSVITINVGSRVVYSISVISAQDHCESDIA